MSPPRAVSNHVKALGVVVLASMLCTAVLIHTSQRPTASKPLVLAMDNRKSFRDDGSATPAPLDESDDDARLDPSKRFAYVFYVTSDTYACPLLHLLDQLVNTVKMQSDRSDLVVLHSSAVSTAALVKIQEAFHAKLILVDPILADTSDPTWRESLTKLNAFRDWGYDRVVYMDADAVPLQNLDHLFDLPPAPLSAPTANWLAQPFFSSALMVIEPSDARFMEMVHLAQTRGETAGFDMDVLNAFFKDTVQYLPGDYTVLNSDFRAKPEAKNPLYATTTELKAHAMVVHFSCNPDGSYGKPWTAGTSRDMPFAAIQGLDPLFAKLFEDYWTTQRTRCQ